MNHSVTMLQSPKVKTSFMTRGVLILLALSLGVSVSLAQETASRPPAPVQWVATWGGLTGPGQFNKPIGVAIDRSGNIYVADSENHRVQKLNPSGAFMASWGSWGFGGGRFRTPTGIAVDEAGHVYVTDKANHRVQKLSPSGAHLATWGTYGGGDGQFRQPTGVAVDRAGNVYVADSENHRTQKFDTGGKFRLKMGLRGQR